ncbi:hypothetical protein PCC9214_03804 [Planktothrix tepida]|uniref:Uncharacterized protein n=1 Tax=Planktothrix tepida PCC 9214 TaxID=671072 RepID=A0A1J1LU35_9CYAN|nr:hypothetical protein [Planktothrix tepida]CAD5970894.1 hypothetical protein PCC9214_03804 [Planktothrix tepida]CUR35356.1 hypothetical protein PL9214650795 [Planktothrix tepida PCC 9214]
MSCPQVGCKLRKTSENQAVCLKNGCVFRLEKQQTVDNNGILWFLLIALFVFIIVVARE